MSEYYSGVTFPQQKVTPSDDAVLRRAVLDDSILSGCALSYAGSTLTMDPGLIIACGREFRHTSVQNWAVTGAASGYARLVLAIDTTRASTKEVFDQIVDRVEYAATLDGFLDLQQEDVNEAGTVYEVQICVVSLGAGGITGIVEQLGYAPKFIPVNWQPTQEEIARMIANVPIILSAEHYGPNLPAEATAGRIFYKKVT